ncbi:MAG: hypothetical protein ABEJ58_07685 [Halodesulfurarchaeum sp.]
MPDMEISERQRDALESVRDDLEATLVGPYGHVRLQDALQYLLDRYGTDDDVLLLSLIEDRLASRSYQELQQLAGSIDGVEPGGKEPDLRRRLTIGLGREVFGIDDPESSLASRTQSAGHRSVSSGAESPDSSRTVEESGTDPAETSDEGEEDSSVDDGATESSTKTESDDAGPASVDSDASHAENSASDHSQSSASRLQQMMGLLNQYRDQWSETDTEEGRYAVTLQDGSTEVVRTKDDVRAVLFKEYE